MARLGEAPRALPAGRRLAGRLRVPPSKSVTNRYLDLALLAGRPVTIERPLLADDTLAFAAALEQLGLSVEQSPAELRIAPGAARREAEIDCRASGTMARFLTAALAALPGAWRLDGAPRLRERPLGPLVTALRELGAGIECLGEEGHLPLAVRGGRLTGGDVRLEAGESSQYLSALLLAAPRAAGEVTIEVGALASAPYVELTLEALRAFGGDVARRGRRLRVRPGPLHGGRYRVEGDASAACYPAAAAALAGGRVELEGLRPGSRQGDLRFFELLERMGAAIEWRPQDVLSVAGEGRLEAVDVDMADLPDQVPTLAALAPFARGTTRIRNVAHLRIKESDRLRACAAELRRVGATVVEKDDGLIIPGVWAGTPPAGGPVVVDSHDDHRIAMSFAVLGLRRPGLAVAEPRTVDKSYPAFWTDLERLVAG